MASQEEFSSKSDGGKTGKITVDHWNITTPVAVALSQGELTKELLVSCMYVRVDGWCSVCVMWMWDGRVGGDSVGAFVGPHEDYVGNVTSTKITLET